MTFFSDVNSTTCIQSQFSYAICSEGRRAFVGLALSEHDSNTSMFSSFLDVEYASLGYTPRHRSCALASPSESIKKNLRDFHISSSIIRASSLTPIAMLYISSFYAVVA